MHEATPSEYLIWEPRSLKTKTAVELNGKSALEVTSFLFAYVLVNVYE